ncbi:hypothetical protein U2F58_03495 [Lactobacillus johnsonii]|uniref:hypothetical protein n=1 Tax=Lactobacillus johnsonii TaxID=33959 RepID=UPI00398A73E3
MMNQNESEKTLIQNLEEFATEQGIDCVWLDTDPKYIPVSYPKDRVVFMNKNWEYGEKSSLALAYGIEAVIHENSSVDALNAYAQNLIKESKHCIRI